MKYIELQPGDLVIECPDNSDNVRRTIYRHRLRAKEFALILRIEVLDQSRCDSPGIRRMFDTMSYRIHYLQQDKPASFLVSERLYIPPIFKIFRCGKPLEH